MTTPITKSENVPSVRIASRAACSLMFLILMPLFGIALAPVMYPEPGVSQ